MICDVKDIPIFYQEYGRGVPVLCMHGYMCDHRLMTGCLEPVFARTSGYRRIYIDLPGMGNTPAPSWLENADQMMDIVIQFVKNTIGDEKFLVAGESYGGYLTLGLLCKMAEQISGILLVAPAVKADKSKRLLPQKQLLYTEPGFVPIEEYREVAAMATPRGYDAYMYQVMVGISAADADFIQRYAANGYALTCENEFNRLKYSGPATVILGRQDYVVGYADALALLENFSRATFAVLDCAGHGVQVEQEAIFNKCVEDWLWRAENTGGK